MATKNVNRLLKTTPSGNMDDYIAGFPTNVRKKLQQMRTTIRKSAPKAEETIKYAIPTFTLYGNLVSFAAYKNHIGFYPAPTEVAEFKKELSSYSASKATARFPLDRPLPLSLISRMVKFQAKRNSEKAAAKK